MIVADTERLRRMDRLATQRFGIPSLLLMENAGSACAREILRWKRARPLRAAVFCGRGNNGGDGYVVARHLLTSGSAHVRVYDFGAPPARLKDARLNRRILERMRVTITNLSGSARSRAARLAGLSRCDVLVDALLGIGLSRPPDPAMAEVIAALNGSGRPILAVDVPSGLDADTGKTPGSAIRASRTVTFACLKKGMARPEARPWTGRILVADISIPPELARSR